MSTSGRKRDSFRLMKSSRSQEMLDSQDLTNQQVIRSTAHCSTLSKTRPSLRFIFPVRFCPSHLVLLFTYMSFLFCQSYLFTKSCNLQEMKPCMYANVFLVKLEVHVSVMLCRTSTYIFAMIVLISCMKYLSFNDILFPMAEYGGAGLDFSYNMAMAEELGSIHCGGIPMAIGVQSDMSTPALARYDMKGHQG